MKANRYRRHEYDVVIIGSGIGGLTAGAYLARQGVKVLVCERNTRPGGYFTSFKYKGYTFDGGIQGCEDSGMLLPMLRQLELHNRIELRRSKVAFAMPDCIIPLEHITDLARFYDHLATVFPHESRALGRIKKESLELCTMMDAFVKGPNPLYQPLAEMLRAMPGWLIRHASAMKHAPMFWRLFQIPIEEYLGTFVADPDLVRFLSIGYRGNPAAFGLTFLYTMMDYYYPAKGGVQAIPDLLVKCIMENHGEVRYRTLVEKIIVEHGAATGVAFQGGEMIRAPFVINNGDLRRTFSEMVPRESVPDAYARQLHNSQVSESVFSVYLGVDMAPEHIPTQGCPHILMMPEYTTIDHTEIHLNPDFYRYAVIMISLPSLHDRTLAPKGKSVVIVQTPASMDSLDRWGTRNGMRTRQYRASKKRIARQVISNVEKLIPGLSKKIEVQIESTPFTLRDYTLNSSGAAVGWTYHPRETYRGGLKGLLGSSNTPIKNLYQVGHWTMSPGGAPAGFITGKIVSSTILRRLRWGR